MAVPSLPCIACGRELKQVFDDASGNQPYAGTEFKTYGHYGSTSADFMDGHYLVVNICDLCLIAHHDRVMIGRDRRPITEDGVIQGWEDINYLPLPWNPSKREIDWVIEQTRKEFELKGEDEETEARHHGHMDTRHLKGLVEARRQLPPPSERRALRVEAGLALADIAETIGCTRQAVANWENGTAHPRGNNLRSYANVLDLLRRELGAMPK